MLLHSSPQIVELHPYLSGPDTMHAMRLRFVSLTLLLLFTCGWAQAQPSWDSRLLWRDGATEFNGDVTLSPDGGSFLQVGDGQARVFYTSTGTLRAVFAGQGTWTTTFKFLNKDELVFWSQKGSIYRLNIDSGEKQLVTSNYNGFVSSIYPSPDGKFLAIPLLTGMSGTAIYNLETGQEVARLGPSSIPTWSPNSATIIYRGPVIFKTNGSRIKLYTFSSKEEPYIRVSSNGTIYQFLNFSHIIQTYSPTGDLLGSGECPLVNGYQLFSMSPDGQHLVYTNSDGVTFFKAVSPFTTEGFIPTPNYSPRSTTFNSSGDLFVWAVRMRELGSSLSYCNLLQFRPTFNPLGAALVSNLGGNKWQYRKEKLVMDDYRGTGPAYYNTDVDARSQEQWVRSLKTNTPLASFLSDAASYSADGRYMLRLNLTRTGSSLAIPYTNYLLEMGRRNRFLFSLEDYRAQVREYKNSAWTVLRTFPAGPAYKFDPLCNKLVLRTADFNRKLQVVDIATGNLLGSVNEPKDALGSSTLINYWLTEKGYFAIHYKSNGPNGDRESSHTVDLYRLSGVSATLYRRFYQPGVYEGNIVQVLSAATSPDGEWVLMSNTLPDAVGALEPSTLMLPRLQYCRIVDGTVVETEMRAAFGAGIKRITFSPDGTRMLFDHTLTYISSWSARPVLKTVILDKASSVGGVAGTGTITMSIPAEAGGITIALKSSSASMLVPATVTIPEGATSTTFNYSTLAVKATKTVTVTASFDALNVLDKLVLQP